MQNLLDGKFMGDLYVVNPKEEKVQGLACYPDVKSLPQTDLAILAIAARYCPDTLETLVRLKGTRGFIVLSAGFGEESEEGKEMEMHMSAILESVNGSMIGPNCIGVINRVYRGVFTSPIPKLDPKGCDFISGSGATAVFIMEAGIPKGLTFSSIFSVGNSAQTGVEDVLQHLDETFDEETSSKVILLYIETIEDPQLLLRHAVSLVRKGCRIAAIKSGTTKEGSRAASSHTGALASPEAAVDALFRKAGIVRCQGREELIAVASVFQHPELLGNRMAIITHAGGPAVMLTDVLAEGGLEVPRLENPKAAELLQLLSPGSSTVNPIDMLATATAEHLGLAIDYCEKHFREIDGMIVIFGTPGLFKVSDVYSVLDEKMKTCRKPIFAVLPSIVNAREEIGEFLASGRINFPDEVALGRALVKVARSHPPGELAGRRLVESPTLREKPGTEKKPESIVQKRIRGIIAEAIRDLGVNQPGSENPIQLRKGRITAFNAPGGVDGYLTPNRVQDLLDAAGIPRCRESIADNKVDAVLRAEEIGFPVVMKAVGPLHKTDAGGVVLNIDSPARVTEEFERLIKIKEAEAVLIQPMLRGLELFAGARREDSYGHLVVCGLGGIFVEALEDVRTELVPLSLEETKRMIKDLRAYPVIRGSRGKEGIDIEAFAGILLKLSRLVEAAPEIAELDLNPLLGTSDEILAVDARIRIST